MKRRMRDLRQGILQRCADSGLGVACAEAQADGVPCNALDRECTSCERGAAAVVAQPVSPTERPALSPP